MAKPCCECGGDSITEDNHTDEPDANCDRCGKPMCQDCFDNASEYFEGDDIDCTFSACSDCMRIFANQQKRQKNRDVNIEEI